MHGAGQAFHVDAASVATGNARRDRHLRSPDFLAASEHPYVRFASAAARLDGDSLMVRGQLSARGGTGRVIESAP